MQSHVIELVWQFFDNGVGGFLKCKGCPQGKPECASYGIVKTGEILQNGVGWQCEYLKTEREKAYCFAPELDVED